MKRALHAIFVTSFTTSAAFLATALSPLIPLRSFGIFSRAGHLLRLLHQRRRAASR